MKRFVALAVLPLLAGPAPPVGSLPDVQPPGEEQLAGDPPLTRMRVTLACGMAPPTSFLQWSHHADAIVRVRIDAHRTFEEYRDAEREPDIMTELLATVLEVFKLHPEGVGAGATMAITHPGGIILREDGPEMHETNGFPPPAVGTEWFLFLRWQQETRQFWISYLEHGAFQVLNGLIAPESERGVSEAVQEAEAFAEALRNAAPAPLLR